METRHTNPQPSRGIASKDPPIGTMAPNALSKGTFKEPPENEPRPHEQPPRKELEERIQSLTESLQRMAADFDNYKKRIAKEAAHLQEGASRELAKDLLPVLDHAELAVMAFPVEKAHSGQEHCLQEQELGSKEPKQSPCCSSTNSSPNKKEGLREHRACSSQSPDRAARAGYEMLFAQLTSVLEKHGLKAMEVLGARFDPHIHEALLSEPGTEKNKVVEVLQKGYLFNGKLLRPAKVKITS